MKNKWKYTFTCKKCRTSQVIAEHAGFLGYEKIGNFGALSDTAKYRLRNYPFAELFAEHAGHDCLAWGEGPSNTSFYVSEGKLCRTEGYATRNVIIEDYSTYNVLKMHRNAL